MKNTIQPEIGLDSLEGRVARSVKKLALLFALYNNHMIDGS